MIRHFERSAPSYADSYRPEAASSTSYFFKARQEIVLSRLGDLKGGKLLDIACGPGVMAEPCTNMGFLYVGIDISNAMISECRKKFHDLGSARFCVGKMQRLPFVDDYFDILLCLGGLEYVPAAEEVAAKLEMLRVLKPGGLLIISHLNRLSPYWLWSRLVYHGFRRMKSRARALLSRGMQDHRTEDVPLREFTERSSRRFMDSRRHTVIETLYYSFNVLLPPFDDRFPRLAVRTCEKLEGLRNTTLRWLAMAFILVVRKSDPEMARRHGGVRNG